MKFHNFFLKRESCKQSKRNLQNWQVNWYRHGARLQGKSEAFQFNAFATRTQYESTSFQNDDSTGLKVLHSEL